MAVIAYVSRIWYAATNATTVSQMSFCRARMPSPVRAFR